MRTAKQWSEAFSRKVLNRLYIDRGDYRNTVFIAGTGRSGTTWLEDIINFEHDHRVLFEPFHSREIPLVAHWNYRQYLRAANHDPAFLEPARQILAGRVRHPWIDQVNEKHFVTRRLVKDIRANLILHWMHAHFPEIPIVLLLRHPCAVARSKLAMGWKTHLDDFLSQPELIADHLAPFVPLLESAHDEFERHILLWCVENWVPLCQFAPGEIHVCFYEDLCLHPEREARTLLNFLRRPFRADLLQSMSRPSALSKAHSAIVTGESVLDAWRKHISPPQIERAVELLAHFGMDRIYGAESTPQMSAARVLESFPSNAYGALARPVADQSMAIV